MKLEDIKTKTKDAVDYLVQSLESGHSEVLTQYLGTMARFHTYSFGNVMLIARQKPDASNVAGIRTWNSLGRFVKRGEKGILILAPMVGYRRSRQNEIATDIDTDNAADQRKAEHQLIGFRAVYVFDRLSRDLRPSLCAPDGCRLCQCGKSSRQQKGHHRSTPLPYATLPDARVPSIGIFCPSIWVRLAKSRGQQFNFRPADDPGVSGSVISFDRYSFTDSKPYVCSVLP